WTFIVGPINRSITLTQLRELAETGEPSGELKLILRLAGQDPAAVARILTDEVEFDLVTAYRIVSSRPGMAVLEQLGKIVAPRNANSAGAQALSGALLLSLADDNKFTILELLDQYPTDARINVDELMSASDQFGDVGSLLESVTGGF
ncbi:MAG: alpha/beta hydrolase, partial [Prochlorothrix sp.]